MEKEHQEVKRSTTSDVSHVCKVCTCRFVTQQECLKHELLKHSLFKNRPPKLKGKHLKTVFQTLNNADMKELQVQVEAAVDGCQGEELKAILKLYCIETERLEQAYMQIYTCLRKELQKIGKFNICPFGSVANGLALKCSDIDIYLESEDYSAYTDAHSRIIFNRVSSFLFRSESFSEVVPIRQARVPIIKCKHWPSGYSIDINMSCPSSVNNTNFLRDIIRCDSRLHQLFLFLKIWAKHLQIIGRGGNMTSYCLITLVLFYLQNASNSKDQLEYPILPSLEELQKYVRAAVVQGINYAYNLDRIAPLAKYHTVRSLIEGFFLFYHKFDFKNNIVSPYLGQKISRAEFIADNPKFKIYKDQLRALTILNNIPALPLQVHQYMCVQDPFCLNLNVARSVTPTNFEYISNCLSAATNICTTGSNQQISDGDFYKLLLFDVITQICKIDLLHRSQDPSEAVGFSSSQLNFTIIPRRLEMRSLVVHAKDIENDRVSLHKLWMQYYIELIQDILVDIYNFDMQGAQPIDCLKNQKLSDSKVTHSWVLNGSVDMWTGRTFEKNTTEFMERQKQLTKTFQKERRQNSKYAVELKALLTLSIRNDSAIQLKIQQMDSAMDVNKKSPLCKFFRNFKVCIQNCNFKEKLLTSSEKLLIGLSNAGFKSEVIEEVRTEAKGSN